MRPAITKRVDVSRWESPKAQGSIDVEFWHLKFAQQNETRRRVKELYAVCGQAQKSIRWLEKPMDLVTHLMQWKPRRFLGDEGTRYEIGAEKDLLRIREKCFRRYGSKGLLPMAGTAPLGTVLFTVTLTVRCGILNKVLSNPMHKGMNKASNSSANEDARLRQIHV